jgi:hypothetical protein
MAVPDLTNYNLFAKVANRDRNASVGLGGALHEATQGVAQPSVQSEPVVQQPQQPQVQPQQPVQSVNTSVVPQQRPIRSTEELAAAMGYTSPEQEERLRRASVSNQRMLAVADALRHIGNIAHTVDYSPSQQFNQPWAEEQARYERGRAMRDKANQALLSYEQAKAAQDAKQRQWEAQFKYNQEKDAANAQALKDYRDAMLQSREDQLAYRKENDAANRALRQGQYDRQNEFTQQRIELSAAKKGVSGGGRRSSGGSRAGSGGGKYWLTDEEGNVHYYPNKTMWEQGIAEYGGNVSKDRSVRNGVDVFGNPQNKIVQRKSADIGGEMARRGKANAAAKAKAASRKASTKTVAAAPPKKKATGTRGTKSNKSGFFNS